MKRRQFETDTRFLLDTANHRLEIIRDDGLYRHLRMKEPGTSCYYYDVITWPGYLTVTGDMGTWTFSRIADMFNFFGSWDGVINTGYWSEKLEAGSGCSARDLLAKEYDHEAFCKSLKESLSDYLEDDGEAEQEEEDWDDEDCTPDSEKATVREIVCDLCRAGFNSEHEAYQAVYDADWPEGWSAWDVCDGLTFKTYTSHFRWILFAITWAISKYHNTKLVERSMSTFLAFKGASSDERMCNVNDEVREMARRLLAAEVEIHEYRKASKEPVAWRCNSGTFADLHVVTLSRTVADSWIGKQREITPLYTAPPQAVTVPPEMKLNEIIGWYENGDGKRYSHAEKTGWNLCREAMLRAEPVSQTYKLPIGAAPKQENIK